MTAQRREGPDSLEAGHERREIAGVPVAVTDSSDRGETLLAPTLGIVIRTRPGERTDEVREVLGTLSPTSQAGRDEVLTGRLWPDGAPNGSEPKPLELWAFAPDGRVHLWHRTEAREDGWGHEGLLGWPGTTPERFAARLRIDGEVRVAAGRPGEEGKEVYAFPTDEWVPDVDSWSPSGHGIVWFDRESATPTAGIAVWEDADALADGQPPVVEQEVAVEGAEHPEHEEEGLGSLSWEEGGDLRDRNWGLVAQLERDEDGFPQLPDPLVFEPYK